MMRLIKKLVLFFAGILVLNIALAKPVLIDGIAAHVNKETITIGDVMTVIRLVRRQLTLKYNNKELLEKLDRAYDEGLKSLIERRLILDFYNEQEAKIPAWIVEKRINEIVHNSFKGDRIALMNALASEHVAFDEWQNKVRDDIIVASMRNLNIEGKIRVSPQILHDIYNKNVMKYKIPEQIKLRMIVIKKSTADVDVTLKRKNAENIKRKLDAGEDFSILAKDLSEGDKAESGGDLGWINPNILKKELIDEISHLKPGEISGIIEIGSEFYILKLEGRKEEMTASFEDIQQDIESEYRKEKARELYTAWIDELKKTAYIKIYDVNPFK